MITNKKNIIFLIIIFFLVFSILNRAYALPIGTILYKTSEEGRMFGYNDFEFSLVPGQIYPGGAAIYIGIGKKSGLPQVAEADHNGVRIIPAKYFVDLDKGEKFIGAKKPKRFDSTDNKLVASMLQNILHQTYEQESFDFSYHTQKGPSDGDWTSVGFVEKMFESAGRASLTYHVSPDWTYDTNYYSINITPDGFNNEEVINDHGDVFSTSTEFSKIHKLGKGDFWEKFAVKEVKNFTQALGEAGEVINQIINTNIFGKNYKGNRYFFFPYTQFQQETLKNVRVDIVVSSHGKSELPKTLLEADIRKKVSLAFSKRLVIEFTPQVVKRFVLEYLGLGRVVSVFNAVKDGLDLFGDGIELATGGTVKINATSDTLKKIVSASKRIQAAVSDIEESIQYIDAKSREMDEVSDRNSILAKKQKEKQEKIKEMAAEIDTTEEIIEDTRPTIERFEEIKDVVEEVVEEEIEIEETIEAVEEIIEEVGGPDTLELDENIEKAKEELPEQEPVQEIVYQFGSVVINEFMANPNSGESEWIEIYNTTGQSINLSDWSIEDNTGKEKRLGKIILAPYSFVTLEHGKEINFFLNNNGDIIKLKYKDILIDSVAYGDFDDGNTSDNAPRPEKGQALARAQDSQDTNQDNNDWFITITPTQGLMNQISAPIIETTQITQPQVYYGGGGSSASSYQAYQTGDAVINEIMYNVSGSDPSHEWFEIYNPGSSEVDLSGWKFYEAEINHRLVLKQGDWTLAAGAYAVIADDADQFLIDYSNFSGTVFDSSFSLNNTSETIAIKDGQGNIIDQITYLSEWGGDGNGNSIEKKSDGIWEQSSSINGTPGQENSEQTYSASGEQESEDITAPDITGLSDDSTPTKSKIWNWTSSDSTAQFRYIINQSSIWASVGEYGSTETATQNIGDGIYYLHVQAKDNLGNESEVVTVSAVLDNTSPTVILSEKPSDPTNQTTTNIIVSGDDVTHYKYKLDNEEYSNETEISTNITLSGLSDSEHTIYIIGKDTAGNWQEQANAASYIWTIEFESEFSYSSDDAVINEIMYNPYGSDTGHEWIEIYNTINENIDLTNWKFYEAEINHRLVLKQGDWTLAAGAYAVIADDADQFLIDYSNFSGTVFDSSFSLNNTSETIAIKDGQGNIIDQITYLNEWGGDGDGNSIEKKSNGSWEQSLSEGGTPGQENSASQVVDTDSDGIVDTEDNCPNNANADQADEDNDGIGNVCDSDYEETPADTTPPIAELIGQPSNPTNETTADITVSGDDVISYKYKLDDGEYGNETVVAVHITLSGLSDAEYTIYIIGKDTAGNWQEQVNATTHSWTIDTTGPSSSITDPGDIFNEGSWPVIIAGTTSSDTNQVEIQVQQGTGTYYLDPDLVWQENNSSLWISNGVNLNTNDNTWSYSLPVVKLDQDNNYFFRSRAKDILGNIQASLSEIDFIFDKTPPGKVINLYVQEQATPLDLRLSWDEINDNFSGINYYEIDWGSEIVTATNQLYNLTGTNRTTYPFKVRACDKASNCGEWSDIESHPIAIESLVISEVQISGNKEFVELYNPTNDNIFLDDWYFAYYSSNQDWSGATSDNPNKKPHRLKQFPDGAIIQSQGYYLIGVYDVSEFQVDWQVKTNENQPYSSGQLSNTDGSIVIYSSSPSGKSSETLKKEYIDAVAWGDTSYVKEGDDNASVPAENQSLERDVNQAQDTDNNANDFSVQATPNPQSVYGLWLSGWDKRKILVINNKENANNLTNYQIKIDIIYQSEMQSDFSDIRFTSSNGQTLLSYYREEYTENNSAVFWVKVPSISAYSEVIIFQYYDNSTATYDGNGQNVFEFFDDFSTIRGDDYDLLNALWTTPGYVKFYNPPGQGDNDDYGYISPKNIEMKNFYVKTSMKLSSDGPSKARQASIDYRKSDSDNYWRFGIDNQLTNNSYRGVRFDKSVSTDDGTAVNILGHDTGLSNSFDEWSTYEVWAYETNHQTDIDNNSFSMDAWSLTSHYLDQIGRIYIRGGDIDANTYVWVDYLMIAKYTLPEPTILTDKSEGYIAVSGQVRNSYANFLNWDNRKTITITNVTNTTSTDPLVDYPIKIEMNYLTGMNTDFSDIRFTDSDGQTVLGYWNESYIVSTSAVFWAKVPSIPANGTKTIYMYYNNPSATYIGNGKNVFTWFDDFETYRQSEYDQFNAVWQSKEGYVKFYSTGSATNYGYLNPKNLQMKDLYIKARMKLTTAAPRKANQAFVDYRYQDTDNYWRFGLNQKGSYNYRGVNLESNEEGTLFLEAYYNLEQFRDEWDTYEVWAADNNHKSRFVDANGNEIVTWEKITDTLNQTGDIYLRGGELESTSVYTLLDYLIIAQYKEPELTVSISN